MFVPISRKYVRQSWVKLKWNLFGKQYRLSWAQQRPTRRNRVNFQLGRGCMNRILITHKAREYWQTFVNWRLLPLTNWNPHSTQTTDRFCGVPSQRKICQKISFLFANRHMPTTEAEVSFGDFLRPVHHKNCSSAGLSKVTRSFQLCTMKSLERVPYLHVRLFLSIFARTPSFPTLNVLMISSIKGKTVPVYNLFSTIWISL